MSVRVTIREKDGSLWVTGSGENAHHAALRACLRNPYLTPESRAVIDRLCNERIPDVTFPLEGGFYKVKCVRRGCRVTIALSGPERLATANALKRLAEGLPADVPSDSAAEFCSPVCEMEESFSASTEMLNMARAALAARGANTPDRATVEAVAGYIARTGTPPAELLVDTDQSRPGTAVSGAGRETPRQQPTRAFYPQSPILPSSGALSPHATPSRVRGRARGPISTSASGAFTQTSASGTFCGSPLSTERGTPVHDYFITPLDFAFDPLEGRLPAAAGPLEGYTVPLALPSSPPPALYLYSQSAGHPLQNNSRGR
jgi:hypothetical protein